MGSGKELQQGEVTGPTEEELKARVVCLEPRAGHSYLKDSSLQLMLCALRCHTTKSYEVVPLLFVCEASRQLAEELERKAREAEEAKEKAKERQFPTHVCSGRFGIAKTV